MVGQVETREQSAARHSGKQSSSKRRRCEVDEQEPKQSMERSRRVLCCERLTVRLRSLLNAFQLAQLSFSLEIIWLSLLFFQVGERIYTVQVYEEVRSNTKAPKHKYCSSSPGACFR